MIAALRERAHLVDEALRGAHAPGGHHQPLESEPVLCERHRPALGADQVGNGDADVVERHDRVFVGDVVRVLRRADHFHAGPRKVDDQQHMVARMFAALQDRLDEDVVGEVERRDMPLGSVDHVLVTLMRRAVVCSADTSEPANSSVIA